MVLHLAALSPTPCPCHTCFVLSSEAALFPPCKPASQDQAPVAISMCCLEQRSCQEQTSQVPLHLTFCASHLSPEWALRLSSEGGSYQSACSPGATGPAWLQGVESSFCLQSFHFPCSLPTGWLCLIMRVASNLPTAQVSPEFWAFPLTVWRVSYGKGSASGHRTVLPAFCTQGTVF